MKPIFFIFIIGLCLRLISCYPIFSNIELAYKNDTPTFKNIAINFASGNGYSACKAPPYYFDSIRTPGYPLFLSFFYKLRCSDWIIILTQILLSSFLILLVYQTALFYGSQISANVSAIFVAFNSHLLVYSGYVLSEILFTLLLTASFFLLLKKNPSYIKSLAATLLYCMGLLTQPILLYLTPFFLLMVYISHNGKASLISFIFILTVSFSWMSNMNSKTGHFTISSLQAYNSYATYGNYIYSMKNGISEAESREAMLLQLDNNPFTDCSGSYEYISEMTNKGQGLIYDGIGSLILGIPKFLTHALLPDVAEIGRVWGWFSSGAGTLSVLNSKGLIEGSKHFFNNTSTGIFAVIPFIFLWLITLSFFVFSTIRNRKDLKVIALVAFIISYIIIPGPASSPRFTMCVLPLISLVAGIGIMPGKRFLTKSNI